MSPTGGFLIFLLLSFCAFCVEGWQQRVPSAPQNLDVIQYNATTYKVTWSPPEQSHGQIFGYYVFQDKLSNGQPIANGRRKAAALMDKDINSALISNFDPNTEYVLRVNAFNAFGDGEYASSQKFLTGRSPPQPPRVQSVTLVDENQPLRARVEWLAPVDKSDGSTAPVQQYFIWYGPVGGDLTQWQKLETDGSSRGVLLDDLMMGTEYEIQLASWNEDGQSENSTERLNTPVGRPSGIPLNVQYSLSEDKIFFQWDAPEVSKRNGPITGYHPVLACNDNSQPRHQNVTRQWTTYSIDPKKSYGFRVAANTARGSGPYSDQIRIRPSDSGDVPFCPIKGELLRKHLKRSPPPIFID